MSMKPGATIRPVASKTSVFSERELFPGSAIWAMRSPSRRMSRVASVLEAGSRTRPFLIRSISGFLGFERGVALENRMFAFGGADGQEIKNGHAHGNAVGDLFENGGLRTVGDFGSNFRAAIDGAGMEDQCVGLGAAHTLLVQLIQQKVIVVGERWFVHALGLHTEDDDDVGIFQRFLDTIDAADRCAGRADFFQFPWNPHRRSA